MELERLTIRAPIASTVLQVNAKVGELATPASPQPLMSLGDLSALRVRAELDERDVGKIKLAVSSPARSLNIAPVIRPGHIKSSETRNLTDFGVTEVLIDLADPGPLVEGESKSVFPGRR